MANELVINYPTGATLYALLFDATGQVWNGSAFAAPSSTSWTDYDIAMTEVATATGVYRGTMPAAAAGVYGWTVRKQAGGAPAASDVTVGVGRIEWSGAAEIMPASTTNITGGTINSVLGTVSADVVKIAGDTDPVDTLVSALGTGGLVEKLNSMLEAAGVAYRFTAAALAAAPTEAGSGTGTYTDTIKDPSNNPLDGARVQLSTDAAGLHRIYEAFTNALGVFTMNPDPGTYYRWIDLAGYTDRLTQGAQVTVT